MRNCNATWLFTGLLFFSLTLSGCKKLLDYVIKNPDVTQPGCRIVSFSSTSHHPDRTGTIYYNKKGNPDSVVYDHPVDGAANYWFLYDDKDRLIECRQLLPYWGVDTCCGGGCIDKELIWMEEWSKYGYDSKNRIVTDTTYILPIYRPGQETPIVVCEEEYPHYPPIISKYSYDQYDRVIKKVSDGGATELLEFKYDSRGNLIDPLRKYDDKTSFLRTNKVWMFLQLDYSLNNSLPAVSYNNKGLPKAFNANVDRYYFRFLKTDFSKSTFNYLCK